MTTRRGATDLAGVLAVDKPPGITSHDVIAVVRRATGERRIGHTGTLDPMATGLLLVLVGPATRLERYLSGQDKRYEARIAFGTATDTLDADGAVVDSAEVPAHIFDAEVARALLSRFLGPSEQIPPAYSAIKTNGRPAHRRARAGEEVALEPRPIVVHEAVLLGTDPVAHTWDVSWTVSKGTYVRSLARDLGLAAGTVAHLGALRRTQIGPLDVADALSLDEVRTLGESGALARQFIDPVPLLGMPILDVAPQAVANGAAIDPGNPRPPEGARVAVVSDDRLLAVYRTDGASLRPECVLGAGVSR